ncbi:MAG: hypothetical protein ACYCUF_11205 [Acidimicrobiales bacterium]
MTYLPDGKYDAVVVDTETVEENILRIELAITLGPFVGHVVALRSREASRSGLLGDTEFLGLPGTLEVRAGVPSFRPETH